MKQPAHRCHDLIDRHWRFIEARLLGCKAAGAVKQ